MKSSLKSKDNVLKDNLSSEKEARTLPELKLNLTNTSQSPNISPLKDGPPTSECWVELKVRDKFIEKRSHHLSVIHDNKYQVITCSKIIECMSTAEAI
jgi:hypothetical protein